MTTTAVLAYLFIIGYFIIERLLRRGEKALSLQAGEFDRGSSKIIWVSGLFNIFLVLFAPILNSHQIGHWNSAYISWLGLLLMLGGLCKRLHQQQPFQNTLQQINSTPSQPASKATFQQFPEVSHFDLTQLVDKCLGELLGKRGLIGLAVPCGEKAFLKNFCDHLKHELGRSNIQIRQPLSLNPQRDFDSLCVLLSRSWGEVSPPQIEPAVFLANSNLL